MSKNTKFFINAIVVIVVLLVAALIYPNLSKKNESTEQMAVQEETSNMETVAADDKALLPIVKDQNSEEPSQVVKDQNPEEPSQIAEVQNTEEVMEIVTETYAPEEMTEATAEADAPAPEEVVKAIDFQVTDNEGNVVKLSDFEGKPVVVNFWATWCKYCVQEFPSFEGLASEYGDDVEFMMVDLTDRRETVDMAKAFIEENGYTFPVYFDTEASAQIAYGIRSIPMTLFVDKEGNLHQAYLGAMSNETIKSNIEQIK